MKPFSIIVPVYNEEEILERNTEVLIDHANSLALPYEIIIVSNGSTDASRKIGSNLQKFFNLPKRGVGRAFKKGIMESRYDHIVFMDADLSADLAFVDRSNELLDKHVLVLGSKIKGLQHRSLFRRMGSFVFYLSVLFLMGMKYVDYAPGAKAYRKDYLTEFFKYIDDYTSFVLNLT